MRIMRKSFFLFELGAGIALFSQGKNKQAAKWEKVKQTTLGCALQETSLQKLLASDTILFGNKIKHKFVEYFGIVFSSNTVDQ